MSINSSRLNDFNTKSYNITDYIDYNRFKNYKKVNIDYTFSSNNEVITQSPRFTPTKIIASGQETAYTRNQEEFEDESFRKTRLTPEYNKIR